MKLSVIPGSFPGTFTVGHAATAKRPSVRDPRFAPAMSYKDAEWLLINEFGAAKVGKVLASKRLAGANK